MAVPKNLQGIVPNHPTTMAVHTWYVTDCNDTTWSWTGVLNDQLKIFRDEGEDLMVMDGGAVVQWAYVVSIDPNEKNYTQPEPEEEDGGS